MCFFGKWLKMLFEDGGDLVFFVVIVEFMIVNKEGKFRIYKFLKLDNWVSVYFVLFDVWVGEYFVIVFCGGYFYKYIIFFINVYWCLDVVFFVNWMKSFVVFWDLGFFLESKFFLGF